MTFECRTNCKEFSYNYRVMHNYSDHILLSDNKNELAIGKRGNMLFLEEKEEEIEPADVGWFATYKRYGHI